MSKILGISAYFHDSSAAILIDGEIIACAQEERFTREKNTADFPINSIEYCLATAHITISDIDAVVFYEKPFLKFERILETFYNQVPKGLQSFVKAIPEWSSKKLFLKREIRRELKKLDAKTKTKYQIYFSGHHLSHAASAFYPSPYDSAAILCIDAVGEWSTLTIGEGHGNDIQILNELKFPHSLGLLYSSFTYYLGFKVNEGEYKMMGLSPYGNENHNETLKFIEIIKTRLIDIKDDGSFKLNLDQFKFTHGLSMVKDSVWENLFGFKKRLPSDEITSTHANFSLAIQLVTEEIVLKLAQTTAKRTNAKNLCLAGGVALNCVANGKLLKSGIFENIWIQPAAGDAGGSLGAALAFHRLTTPHFKSPKRSNDLMKNALLGPQITINEQSELLKKRTYQRIDSQSELIEKVSNYLINEKIVGWVQGRMEFGPRALGARSILAIPTSSDMQSKLNRAVKFREDFRPFAPVMLDAEAQKYFDFKHGESLMQYALSIKPEFRESLVSNYNDLSIEEQLSVPRSKFPAISHVDFSSRIQVVQDDQHPLFELLKSIKKKTGDGILINTSFNRNGEPIVCSLEDALDCFESTKIDVLVAENLIFTKDYV